MDSLVEVQGDFVPEDENPDPNESALQDTSIPDVIQGINEDAEQDMEDTTMDDTNLEQEDEKVEEDMEEEQEAETSVKQEDIKTEGGTIDGAVAVNEDALHPWMRDGDDYYRVVVCTDKEERTVYRYKPYVQEGKSPVWNYFGFAKLGGAFDTTNAICRLCGAIYRFTGINTGMLHMHMGRMHPVLFRKIKHAIEATKASTSTPGTRRRGRPRKNFSGMGLHPRVAQALQVTPSISERIKRTGAGTTPGRYRKLAGDSEEEEEESRESLVQAEYKEAIKADTIKSSLRRTLGQLLDGEIDFAAEIRFQGTAFIRVDDLNVVKLKVDEFSKRGGERERSQDDAVPSLMHRWTRLGEDGQPRMLVKDPLLVQDILQGRMNKWTQTQGSRLKGGADSGSDTFRKTVLSPEALKGNTKLALPGKQQVNVTFIPKDDVATSAADASSTVDLQQLSGILPSFSGGPNVPQVNEEAAAIANLKATQSTPQGSSFNAADDTLEEHVEMGDNVEETEYDEDEEEDAEDDEQKENEGQEPAGSPEETLAPGGVKVEGLVFDGMPFVLLYTQHNCSRWVCAEKGCRASVNTSPLPKEYTTATLATPKVLCSSPHDVACHMDGKHKVKEEDMRKVRGFVGVAEDDGNEVLAVYGYRFARHSVTGSGGENRWLCVQPGCFTTMFTDDKENLHMFGWPYHSHPPQLYTEPTDQILDGEPSMILTLAKRPRDERTRGRRGGTRKPRGKDRLKQPVIHVQGPVFSYNILQRDGKFYCEHCPKKVFPSLGRAQKHVQCVHNTTCTLPCRLCGSKFKNRPALRKHELTHLDSKDRPFKCECCNKGFVSMGDMKRHMLRKSAAYTCKDCGSAFHKQETYEKHLSDPENCEKARANERPGKKKNTGSNINAHIVFCARCKVTFKDNQSYRLHALKAVCRGEDDAGAPAEGGGDAPGAITSLGRSFGCHRCEALFTDRPMLLRHLLFQCKYRTDLVCTRCDMLFSSEDEHADHIRFCTVKTPSALVQGLHVICTKCGKMFYGKEKYEQHARVCKNPISLAAEDTPRAGPSHAAPPPAKRPRPAATVEDQKAAYMMEQFELKPSNYQEDREFSSRLTTTGRLRKSPKKFADEAYEKGWAETTVSGLLKKVTVSEGVITLSTAGPSMTSKISAPVSLQATSTSTPVPAPALVPSPPSPAAPAEAPAEEQQVVTAQVEEHHTEEPTITTQDVPMQLSQPMQLIQLPDGQIVQAYTIVEGEDMEKTLAAVQAGGDQQQPMQIIIQSDQSVMEIQEGDPSMQVQQQLMEVKQGDEMVVAIEQFEDIPGATSDDTVLHQ